YHEEEHSEGDDEIYDDEEEYDDQDGEVEDEDEDEDGDEDPLLPIFSAEVLDKLPVYNLTHSIRLLVVQRCETTLSWDQLRSPQISQFLIKPIQQQIRNSNFSRATLYALIANALQFQKEGQLNPGTVGISKTRAMICELLAMRLLKEFTIRELIDALSYDFDPLRGMHRNSGTVTPGGIRLRTQASARISTIEVAIRGQSKRFLAHPLVVQQLEAIWAGNIVFHSAADYLHRPPSRQPPFLGQSYGTINSSTVKQNEGEIMYGQHLRRTATLYDPAESSLFKLSRLRVPRYRQLFSTCSFAIMLGLFLAVLIQRSQEITALEVVFWFWSAGYMLDEIVGLTEEGFGLYIMSIWNAFDIGILLLFFAYYALRLYGIVIPTARRRETANMAYDVLASTAVLLFPRLFSVLDHYRYFSQLLIAFRMMALDLAAILILILIACSGFFVAFTVAFSNNEFTAPKAAYTLFQILMGFTPAAWDIWDSYNILGKAILTLFLCICHFLIVTILITVLTNSFMAVVQNANEEHQFLFAVNTISMVKSDALFSYIAPSNVIGWLMRPMTYVLPFRRYVRFNRTIIKLTHFPLLWSIFVYERFVLSRRIYEPTDLVEQRGRSSGKMPAFSMRAPTGGALFSPGARLREPSVATFHKDRALDEVFRRPFKTGSRTNLSDRKKTVVHDWMEGMGDEGGPEEPPEQSRSIVDLLESGRPSYRRSKTGELMAKRHMSLATRSIASDPEELRSSMIGIPKRILEEDEGDEEDLTESRDIEGDSRQQNLYSEDVTPESDQEHVDTGAEESDKENRRFRSSQVGSYFDTSASMRSRPESQGRSGIQASSPVPLAPPQRAIKPRHPLAEQPLSSVSPQKSRRQDRPQRFHHRTISTNTILYSPLDVDSGAQVSQQAQPRRPQGSSSGPTTAKQSSGVITPGRGVLAGGGAKRPPTSGGQAQAKPRPIMPPRGFHETAPNLNLAGFLALDRELDRRKPSFNTIALDLASDLGDNRYRPDVGAISGMPASFSTQLEDEDGENDDEGDGARRMSKLMLARMSNLEEGFREVLNEVR
ncbi:hypothetical protein NA57DRAFT_27077, partial [Rhizodiscina lignyota]